MPFDNARFVADRAGECGGRILDYGCGRGVTLGQLLRDGADAYGVDLFFDGMDWARDVPRDLLREHRIRRIPADGRIPFPDGYFDTIVSDQVLEHVADLELVVTEMSRVLAPGGVMYHQYPTREVVREAHMAVPFSHRLPHLIRVPVMTAAAVLGAGKHRREGEGPRAWARRSSRWIDDFCAYRPRREIERTFRTAGFVVVHAEVRYCTARAGGTRIGRPLALLPDRAVGATFRALGFDAVELRRPGDAPAPPGRSTVRLGHARAAATTAVRRG